VSAGTAPLSPLIPAVHPTRPAKLPAVAERTLGNGLRVVVVRQQTVPLVEVRLRVPFSAPGGDRGRVHDARAALLAETLLSGTAARDAVTLAQEVQALGGSLGAGVDADRLSLGGSALASSLRPLLDLVADVVTGASYPADEVAGERDRLVSELAIARTQPAVIAGVALAGRMFGAHPYGRELPESAALAAVTPAQLRSLHTARVGPAGALLVIVGDVRPAAALDAAEAALSSWSSMAKEAALQRVPTPHPAGAALVDRPGSVQTNIRLGGLGLPRSDAASPALALANLVYGGYFSSRLIANVRERHGYSYTPRSGIEHRAGASLVTVGVDVQTGVTAPALLETQYELGRMATTEVAQGELDAARSYAIGTLALSTATQAGLASTLAALLVAGLDITYLREQPKRLTAVTTADVLEVSARHLAPHRLVTVLVGDAAQVRGPLDALGVVEVLDAQSDGAP